jgi:hypothetical protein
MIKLNEEVLPYELANTLWDYDSNSGVLTWKINKGVAKLGYIAGSTNTRGYINISYGGHLYYAHRLAWLLYYKRWPDSNLIIDHIDGNKTNNKIENLRECTRSQNKQNSTLYKNNALGIKGVRFIAERNLYIARIYVKGQAVYLGSFKTAEDARDAYNTKAEELFGAFHKQS